MKRKRIIFIGIVVAAVGTLLGNFVWSQGSDLSPLMLENVEALAQQESNPSGNTCVESGTICIGIDASGKFGKYPGLAHKN